MFRPRLTFGGRRPRRRASAGVVIVMLLALFGWEHYKDGRQRAQEWAGSIERAYTHRGFFHGRHSESDRYWDVRTSDGRVESVRVRSFALWNSGRRGGVVFKKAGELEPHLVR